ncbi:hypothetical protein QTP86_013724, partial [Hemibagrus guttatus]
YLALKCRPFYAPREFTAILVTAVYIPPQANAKLALEELNEAIYSQVNAYPEGAVIVSGDFNHADLKTVMPRLHTNVHFPTRENNILDQVYTNIPCAYRAAPSPHLGSSDHISIELTPSYRPLICRTQPSFKTVQAYIAFCTDTVLTTKTIKVFPNQKPWLDWKECSLLKARNITYRSGDRLAYSNARRELKKAITEDKQRYQQQIEVHFVNNNPRSMWRGIKAITDYKSSTPLTSHDTTLPDALNEFFACFDNQTSQVDTQTTPLPRDEPVIVLESH